MKIIKPRDILLWNDKYEWERSKIINKEQQQYKPRNSANSEVYDENDIGQVLRMTAIKEEVIGSFFDNEGNQWNRQDYSSAVFTSFDKQEVKTGQYVEARLKLPGNKGIFPAFWLLRSDLVWQKTEIDIVEGVSEVNKGRYHTAFHSHVDWSRTYQKHGSSVDGGNLTSQFNDYGAYIGEDRVDLYFNREKVASIELHDHEKGLSYYMLLNLAVAGEGTWAAGEDTFEPYGWEQAHLYCNQIIIADEVPTYDDEDTGTGPAQIDKVVAQLAEQPVDDITFDAFLIKEAIKRRYEDSTTVAKVLYDLARKLGGKL